MIQSILLAILIYFLFIYKFPNRVVSGLESIFKKFLWEGLKDEKKIPLISWDATCLAKEDGGAGLHKLSLQNQALGAKLIWKMYKTSEKPWCYIMAPKYLDSWEVDRILTVANASSGSHFWKHIWDSCELIT